MTVWLTGLPSAGKSTIAEGVRDRLCGSGLRSAVLDGDDLRRNLTSDLGFSRADREENVRRIGYVARMLAENGVITLVPVIAPYAAIRDEVRTQHQDNDVEFVEAYVATPMEVCSVRDVKGLYAKQRDGVLTGLTGVDDPYEPPDSPELRIDTQNQTVDDSVDTVFDFVTRRTA
jgi:adenylylsulfate kinase